MLQPLFRPALKHSPRNWHKLCAEKTSRRTLYFARESLKVDSYRSAARRSGFLFAEVVMANPLQQNFVTLLSQKVSRKTVLNVLGILSSMVRTAKSWGYCTQAITTSELALPADELKKLTRFFNGMKR